MAESAAGVGGILLTGGLSQRMGSDKALLEVDGLPNAVRLAGVLRQVAAPVVEVGPGRSGLLAVTEEPAGSGPLVALSAGAALLERLGHAGPALVLACDLPFVDAEALEVLVAWPEGGSVVPVAGGQPQPLCARWSASDLRWAARLVEAGERSMKALLNRPGVEFVDEEQWPGREPAGRVFADVDTAEDLRRLGLAPAD